MAVDPPGIRNHMGHPSRAVANSHAPCLLEGEGGDWTTSWVLDHNTRSTVEVRMDIQVI